jgi:hypothetical protein
MSFSNYIWQLGSPNKNQNNTRCFVDGPSKELAGMMARQIQTAVRTREVRRLEAAQHATLLKDQLYRLTLKNDLEHLRSDQPWQQLLHAALDNKTAHTYSKYDRTNVIVKARHVYRAVTAMYVYVGSGMHITWKEQLTASCWYFYPLKNKQQHAVRNLEQFDL